MSLRLAVTAVLLFFFGVAPAWAHEKQTRPGFVDLNLYYDSRQAGVLTTNVLVNLPANLQYFSLSTLQSPLGSERPHDLSGLYSEQNLRWNVLPVVPLDLSTQWVLRAGEDNDALRLGLLWKISRTPGLFRAFQAMNLFLFVNVHAVEIHTQNDGSWRSMLEWVYRLEIAPEPLKRRVYVAGFVDHGFVALPAGTTQSLVTEHQLGVRLFGGLHAVSEVRYDGALEQPLGVAVGVQLFTAFGS